LALDVVSDITVEYLSNVGRTLRLYLDKYSNMMTSEVCHHVSLFVVQQWVDVPKEMILHSLFESGVSRIQGLERYITDDVARHGNRLNELEKKITNVYQEFTSSEAIDDDALFANEDDEEEESAFVMYALCLFAPELCEVDMVVFVQGPIHG
jgi:transcriptional activator SPT7